jgi:hypothetical protein
MPPSLKAATLHVITKCIYGFRVILRTKSYQQQIQIFSLHSVIHFVFVLEQRYASSEVWAELLNVI